MLPLLFVAAAAVALAEDDPAALIEAALAAHPDLESRRALVAEMTEMADVSRAWPDPMLEVMVGDLPVDSWKFSREPMAGVELTLSQMLPEPGSRRHAGEVADADQAMAEADAAQAALDLAREVSSAFWQLALARQQQAIYERHIAATTELTEAVRKSYEVGVTGQSALLRLELLRGRLEQEVAETARMALEQEAALGRALGEPHRKVETPAETAPVAPTGAPADWLAQALGGSPMLGALDAEIARDDARAALARSMALPDLTVYAAYRFRFPQDTGDMGGSDLFSAGVMLPLPVSSAHVAGGERDAALEAARGAAARKESAVLAIESELRMIHAAWARASEKATDYEEDLLPAARKTREATFSDYRVGKAEFEALYMAEVELLELEREAQAAAADTRIRAAEARAVIGADAGGAP